MSKTPAGANFAKTSTENKGSQVKEYKAPELTVYGGISDLVLAMPGTGADGMPPMLPPTSALS